MKEAKALVIDPVGLHARPATVAVNAASKCKCKVTVGFTNAKGETKSVDMKSIMGVMSLGIPTQSEIVITCDGEDEDNSLATIVETLKVQKVIA